MILVLGSLGVAQALFLIVYLATLKTGNRRANVLLAAVLLGLTIRIGKAVILNHVYIGPWLRNLGISGFLLVGPAIWYYGRALFNNEKCFQAAHFLHLIPFGLFVIFSGIIPNNGNLTSSIFYASIQLHLACYLGMAWQLLNRTNGRARISLTSWYRGILIGVTLILVLYVAIFIRLIPLYLLGATSFSFLIYIFWFLFLKKHHFVLEKYAQSAIYLDEAKALMKKADALFQEEAPYLDPETNLHVVAGMLSAKPRALSQAINEIEQKNFSEFVNQYRIAHAKLLLTDPARNQDKIATIAFDCGFGNITSFNVAFKSSEKVTPSQYRKQFATPHPA